MIDSGLILLLPRAHGAFSCHRDHQMKNYFYLRDIYYHLTTCFPLFSRWIAMAITDIHTQFEDVLHRRHNTIYDKATGNFFNDLWWCNTIRMLQASGRHSMSGFMAARTKWCNTPPRKIRLLDTSLKNTMNDYAGWYALIEILRHWSTPQHREIDGWCRAPGRRALVPNAGAIWGRCLTLWRCWRRRRKRKMASPRAYHSHSNAVPASFCHMRFKSSCRRPRRRHDFSIVSTFLLHDAPIAWHIRSYRRAERYRVGLSLQSA